MKKYRILIAVIICLFQITAFAATPTNTLIILLATIQTMKADFTQTTTDTGSKKIQKSSGTMALLRPGKFRWEQSQPLKQLIILNKTKLWIYDPDLEQVTIRSLSKEIGKTPALLLSDPNHALETDYNVDLLSSPSDEIQWFSLTPKDPNSSFEEIRLGFTKLGGVFAVSGMVLKDRLGHTTNILFSNIVSDEPISSSLFNFKIPPHVDVINEG